MVTDAELEALTYALDELSEHVGWREALRQLKAAAGCHNEPMHKAANILLCDFYFLREGGLSARDALYTILDP